MLTFIGRAGLATGVGPTQRTAAEEPGDWMAAFPLWISGTGGPGWRRWVAAPDVVVDVFGFSGRARTRSVQRRARSHAAVT